MSKLSFRARQVDYTKPLPIYLNSELPDLQDFAAINRSVPQMPTGMEKDEEAEHHLQRALSALQAFGDKSSNDYSIPTPKVEIDDEMYNRIYNVECPKYKQYIRIQPFSNDYDYPDYDADYEDEKWLNEQKKKLPDDFNDNLLLYFETIMDRLEKATCFSTNLMSITEAKILLMKDANNDENDFLNNNNSSAFPKPKYRAELEEFLISIYEYWKKKRTKRKHPLTPIVMTDKSAVVTQPNNPYLVFRRRTEKMQTRKNRKNEEQSYEKMLILKRDLCRAQTILKLLKKRENFKKEFLKLTLETFEKRYKLNDYDGSLTDQITCMLKPSASVQPHQSVVNNGYQNNTHLLNLNHNENNHSNIKNYAREKLSQNNNHYNHKNEKNLSSIDKTIVNLINSNKLKTLGSPPHSSLKKVPQLENDFLVDSIYNNDTSNKQQKLNEKQRQRQKKEKRLRDVDSSTSNTISNLISLKQQNSQNLNDLPSKQKILNDLIDLSNKNKAFGQSLKTSSGNQIKTPIANNLQSLKSGQNVSPLTNRSNNKLELLKKSHKLNLNTHELEQLRLNRIANSQRRRNIHNMRNNSNENLNNNTSIDGNNNKKINTSSGSGINTDTQIAESPSKCPTGDNAEFLNIFNELKDYEEELRANQIDNLDSILSETKSRLSTSNDKDGYWYFKRKEGCKYLPQNGPIFKNDVLEESVFAPKPSLTSLPTHTNETPLAAEPLAPSTPHTLQLLNRKNKKSKRKDRLRELQHFYYGYAITKNNRHLGLVRRRVGRGGRIVFDKFNNNLTDCINESDLTRQNKTNPEQMFTFNFSKFKTYHPIESFELNDSSVITNKNSESINNSDSILQLQTQLGSASVNSLDQQNPKKKLKLKNFEDAFKFNDNDDLNDDYADAFYDHCLFPTLQLNSGLNSTQKFINKETETELTVESLPQQLIDEIKIQPKQEPVLTKQIEITNPITYNFDELMRTELDLDNIFEPDNDNVTFSNSNNVIKLEVNEPMNQEYNRNSDSDLLSMSSVKIALKNLRIPVRISEVEIKSDNKDQEYNDKQKANDIDDSNPSIEKSPSKPSTVLMNFNTCESFANITSTTLTPPSPSPPSNTEIKKEPVVVTTDVKDVVPTQAALNKIILSNAQSNSNNPRFSSLNKVGIQNCSKNQLQIRSLSPVSKSNNNTTEQLVNGTSILTTAPNYLVKKHVKTEGASINNTNDNSNIINCNSTSSSSSPSSSNSNLSSSGFTSSISSTSLPSTNGNSSIIHSSPSVIVNGLFSKKKDENNPFYPVIHSDQSNANTTGTSTPNNNNSKLLQVIHFNQSNLKSSIPTLPLSTAAAASSSVPSSSSTPLIGHSYLPNNTTSLIPNHHHLSPFQKPNSSTQPNANGPTSVGNEHSNTAKLM